MTFRQRPIAHLFRGKFRATERSRCRASGQPNPTKWITCSAMLNCDQLEPFFDESIEFVNRRELPTPMENELLASMLAWERAPVLEISKWFTPELALPHPDELSEQELREKLEATIELLYESTSRAGLHRSFERPPTLYACLPRHSSFSGKKDRRFGELSSLGLLGRGRRRSSMAPLLCQRRGSRGLGRGNKCCPAAQGIAAPPADAAPRAGLIASPLTASPSDRPLAIWPLLRGSTGLWLTRFCVALYHPVILTPFSAATSWSRTRLYRRWSIRD